MTNLAIQEMTETTSADYAQYEHNQISKFANHRNLFKDSIGVSQIPITW